MNCYPSVFNMLLEWEGLDVRLTNGDLTPWLLNAALTIQRGKRGSHQDLWGLFTELLVSVISKSVPPSAWILWGKEAQTFDPFIDNKKHYIKTGGHPSPMAAKEFFWWKLLHLC